MIKKNNGKRAKCHRTPPQPRRKSLFETAGEVSKPFVITIITIVAILALLILLFFSKQFVGKAVETIDTAEIALGEVKLGQPIEATVEAFIGDKQTKVINFKLNLPLSIKCVDINKMEQLLEKSFLAPDDITCVNSNQGSKINYVYTTTGELQTGQLQLAKITFKPLAAGTTHSLSLSEFNIVVGGQKVTLTTKPTTITMPKEEGQIKCPEDPKCCGTEKPVDLQTDNNNCGSCGKICGYSLFCIAGNCIPCTGETPNACKDNCVNLQKDSKNCGKCGVACELNEICYMGTCNKNIQEQQIICPEDPKCCNTNNLVNLQTNNNNCGKCGTVCGSGKYCYEGNCIEKVQSGTPCNNNEDCPNGACINSLCQEKASSTPSKVCEISTDCLSNQDCVNKVCQEKASSTPSKVCETSTDCLSNQDCVNKVCQEKAISTPPGTGKVQGTKVVLEDFAPLNNVFSTKITATVDFSQEVEVYTVLYGANNKVLSIKLEKIEGGLKKDASYTAIVNYPQANVKQKTFLLYDVESNPQVHAFYNTTYEGK